MQRRVITQLRTEDNRSTLVSWCSTVTITIVGLTITYSLLLRWPYSPACALASFTIRLQASRSLALSLHSFILIFLRSVDTSSSHLISGLPLRLFAYSFPYIFFRNCGMLHSFYMTKPSYSLAFYKPDNVGSKQRYQQFSNCRPRP